MKLPTWAWIGMAVLLVFGLYQYNKARSAKAELDALKSGDAGGDAGVTND